MRARAVQNCASLSAAFAKLAKFHLMLREAFGAPNSEKAQYYSSQPFCKADNKSVCQYSRVVLSYTAIWKHA